MKDITLRYLNMGRRVTDFTATYGDNFPANTRAGELVSLINEAVTALEAQGVKQDAADLDGQQATDEKKAALAALLDLLRPVNQTARGMEKLFPGISGRFRMPRGSDQNVINRARAMIQEATPISVEFTSRGLPANFLTTLEAATVKVESAIDTQNTALSAQTAATSALNAAQQQLADAVREFAPIVRNILRDDPAALAAWKSASHIEHAPKKTKKPAKTAPPAQTEKA